MYPLNIWDSYSSLVIELANLTAGQGKETANNGIAKKVVSTLSQTNCRFQQDPPTLLAL